MYSLSQNVLYSGKFWKQIVILLEQILMRIVQFVGQRWDVVPRDQISRKIEQVHEHLVTITEKDSNWVRKFLDL